MLKCAGNDDAITMKADDTGDVVTFMFESPGAWWDEDDATRRDATRRDARARRLTEVNDAGQDKISDFELKLMDIDSEHLGIPETDYEVTIRMPSVEFQRICRDLATIGDTVSISVTKDGVKFSTAGDIGDANIMCRQNATDEKEKMISIELNEPVNLTFALRYLNSFTKATPLSDQVMLRLSSQLPIVVQYVVEGIGYVAYFLAPKIEDDME
jgi:proliferating cell nuclear antigen